MFTIFHLFKIVGSLAGALAFMPGGWQRFGWAGALLGIAIGGAVGYILGSIPDLLSLRAMVREMGAKTVPELRALLRSSGCLTPNCVLLELHSRGEDIAQELPLVVELLSSDDFNSRGRGWAALTSAFPELVRKIPDYRISESGEECARKARALGGR